MKFYGEYQGWNIYTLGRKRLMYKATKSNRKDLYASTLRDLKGKIFVLEG